MTAAAADVRHASPGRRRCRKWRRRHSRTNCFEREGHEDDCRAVEGKAARIKTVFRTQLRPMVGDGFPEMAREITGDSDSATDFFATYMMSVLKKPDVLNGDSSKKDLIHLRTWCADYERFDFLAVLGNGDWTPVRARGARRGGRQCRLSGRRGYSSWSASSPERPTSIWRFSWPAITVESGYDFFANQHLL